MNWCGSTSKPILSAGWRSPTKRISRPRSAHPCANYRTTRRKSVPSTKSHPLNTPHENEHTYGLINNLAQIQNRTLHHPTAHTAPAFDNAPITVLLAVLPASRESQVHGPRDYAETQTRKEGRSSLHPFPHHRPLMRLALF